MLKCGKINLLNIFLLESGKMILENAPTMMYLPHSPENFSFFMILFLPQATYLVDLKIVVREVVKEVVGQKCILGPLE